MADDLAPVAVAQHSSFDNNKDCASKLAYSSFADRADRGIEILSRWAGIVTFAAATCSIIWYLV
ncbi:hypothetical protein [Sphingobium sp. Cam5-1]|uniref:hypothetical protein n=1 Tax=Sphingobium sp. Cam5-1 TaxID=2789327 RepID=UPI0018AD10AF|nr:hypothetical protein [Sphingobium sp. Cam5-1]QPI73748.1 hypothetical protein IZV00_04530 [Sphingobium sp. Cam5-1]